MPDAGSRVTRSVRCDSRTPGPHQVGVVAGGSPLSKPPCRRFHHSLGLPLGADFGSTRPPARPSGRGRPVPVVCWTYPTWAPVRVVWSGDSLLDGRPLNRRVEDRHVAAVHADVSPFRPRLELLGLPIPAYIPCSRAADRIALIESEGNPPSRLHFSTTSSRAVRLAPRRSPRRTVFQSPRPDSVRSTRRTS